jgi:hypothetical protein
MDQELALRFTYHPPRVNQAQRYEQMRTNAYELASFITGNVPDSRERSLALTHLEQAVMWANAAIARRE